MASRSKTGVLLVSHGDLCEHFLDAARIIYQSKLGNVETLPIKSTDDRQRVLDQAQGKIGKLGKTTKDVIVLCDTYGATPSRLITEDIFDGRNIICVYGLNLPMLLDCINYSNELPLEQLADKICQTGKDAILYKRAGENGAKKSTDADS